jgi:ribose transport system substrate-binding protein
VPKVIAAIGCAILLVALVPGSAGAADDGPAGITEPQQLPPFDPNATNCAAPTSLERVLAFAQDNKRDFMEGVRHGLEKAAADRALRFDSRLANNDANLMIQQIEGLVADKAGSVVAAPVDPASLAPSIQKLIWRGSYVGMVVPPPATTILNAPQYLTGKVLGDAAAIYIKEQLNGKADVVLLTHDTLQFLAPRFTALRDALKDIPGVNIIADISPATVDVEGGFATMSTVLLANPNVDVVLGADTVVLGALAALRKAGKDRPDQFLGGIDGEPEAVAEIKKGGPYKITVSLASPIFGYALGWYAADWLEGKSVPQAMDILPSALDQSNIASYEADLADPGAVFAAPDRRAKYLRMYGNICYDTRDRYINFPWSSEQN